MTPDLKGLCLRFEQHCDECKECDCCVMSTTVDQGVQLFDISYTDNDKPHLCPEGKDLLLEIFT